MDFSKQFLGDYLHSRRVQFHISLSEIQKDTGIRPEYIDALEKRNFSNLPADIYLIPIVKTYAKYLGIDEKIIVSRLKEEKEDFSKHRSIASQVETTILSHTKPITGKKISLGIAASILSLVAFYITSQFFNVSSPPDLLVFEPTNGVSTNNANIVVKGKTSNGSKIELNGKIISTDSDGNFNIPVNLNAGENHIAIVATSNNGQKIGENLLVYADPPTPPAPLPDHLTKDNLTLKISVTDTSWVSVKADGETIQKTLQPGDTEEINAKSIDLIAGNAGGVVIALNGGNPTILGEKGQVIRKHYSWQDLNLGYATNLK